MIDKNELCEKIRSIYPDIGECGIAVNVEYDETTRHWVVDLKHGGRFGLFWWSPRSTELANCNQARSPAASDSKNTLHLRPYTLNL